MKGRQKWLFGLGPRLLSVCLLLISLALAGCGPAESAEPVATSATAGQITATAPLIARASVTPGPLPATHTPATTPTSLPDTTATPLPTATNTPLPTAPLQLLTPIEIVPAGQPFPLSHDLLFIAGGTLKLWLPNRGQVATLLAPRSDLVVSGWQASPDQQHLAIAMTAPNDGPGFALYHLRSASRQLSLLHEESEHYLAAFAIAADGESLGYIDSNANWQEDAASQSLHVVSTRDGAPLWQQPCPNQRELGGANSFTYSASCFTLTAVPAGGWIWADIEGVWLGGPGQTPTQLVSNVFYDDELPLMYRPTDQWSPDGQYLLLQVSRFEGSWPQLLNLADGSRRDLPHHVLDLGLSSRWQWLPGNILFALHPPHIANEQRLATAAWWAVTSTNFEELAALSLNLGDFWYASDPAAAPDGRLAVALNHDRPDLPASRQIVLLPANAENARTLVHLPPLPPYDSGYAQQLSWLPDGAGLIYLLPGPAPGHQPFYIPADGQILYDLTLLLGMEIEAIFWLP